MLDTEGVVRSWNPGAERLKGYSAREIIGKPFSVFYTPEDREKELPQKALAAVRETGRFNSEGWRVRKDGTRFWALVVLDAIRDEQGRLIGFAKVTRDITERQQAHQELLDSERRYRRLIEAVVDYAIFQLDPAGNVATWNPGAERIKGYASSEIIGSIFNLFYTRKTWNGKWRNRRSPNSPSMAALSGRLANAKGRHVLTEPNMERSNKMIE
jgi:PAS domain S-box-containing protein